MHHLRTAMRILVRSFINTVAGSQIMPKTVRYYMLRAWGMELHSKNIHPRFVFRSPNLYLGENGIISWNVYMDTGAKITIGKNSGVGAGSILITETHELGGPERRYAESITKPITIGEGVWVGVGVIIQPGVTIGDGCIIHAGSVLTGDCEPNSVYGGVPARKISDLPV